MICQEYENDAGEFAGKVLQILYATEVSWYSYLILFSFE